MQPSSNEVFLKGKKKKDGDEERKGEIVMNWMVYLQGK